MFTTGCILRYIHDLPHGQLFTTREVLGYGTRGAVDQALFRLVKKGRIRRLARGVFVVNDWSLPEPSALDVARAKARGFAKSVVTHGADAAYARGLTPAGNAHPTFAINGRSSSFRFGKQTIHLKGVSARKMRAGESKAGLAIRALWHLGRRACTTVTGSNARAGFNRFDHEELRRLICLMPTWLNNCMIKPQIWDPKVAAILFSP